MGAIASGTSEFWRVLNNPGEAEEKQEYRQRLERVRYLGSWYDGTVFLPGEGFRPSLVKQYALYEDTRLCWNPHPQVVDFYAAIEYPGDITAEMDQDSAIPMLARGARPGKPELADAKLRAAAFQALEWGDYNKQKGTAARYRYITGSGLVIAKDDIARGKVYPEVIEPAKVKSVTTDRSGNVKAYTLEFPITPTGAKTEVTYREEVDQNEFRFFLDDKPWDRTKQGGPPAVAANPYKFVPAVYRAGAPVMASALGELAGINSIESHLDDQVHKSIHPTVVFFTRSTEDKKGSGGLVSLMQKLVDKLKERDNIPVGPNGSNWDAPKDLVHFFEGPIGGSATEIAGAGKIGEGLQYLLHKKEAFKSKFPEYTVYDQLRSMPDIAGVAAEILLGDTKPKVLEARAEADPRTIQIIQQCIAIGGMRLSARTGRWADGTLDQRKFAPYGLDSYDRGLLDFRIGPRPFVPDPPMSEQERTDLMIAQHEGLGISVEWLLENVGKVDAGEIPKMGIAPKPGVIGPDDMTAAFAPSEAEAEEGAA